MAKQFDIFSQCTHKSLRGGKRRGEREGERGREREREKERERAREREKEREREREREKEREREREREKEREREREGDACSSGAERRKGGALALGPWAQKVLQNNRSSFAAIDVVCKRPEESNISAHSRNTQSSPLNNLLWEIAVD